jgi:RND family efflux transporter MFP subunit
LVAAAWVVGYGWGRWYFKGSGGAAKPGERRILYYIDPMHPAYKSDKPGTAPDCGMKLEPVYADEGAPAAGEHAGHERKVLYYRDPKDHKYKSDKPGLNPETGNDLEPVYAEDAASMPAGTVKISTEKQQLIGVKFGTVEMAVANRTIRAVGKVAYDETRLARVQTRVEGWIDQVFVDFTGKPVEKGQPMLTLYSPEMLATQQEYLLALRSKEVMRHSTMNGVGDFQESLVQAARRRLELFNLSEAQMAEIEKAKKPLRNITVYAPISGYVLTRNAFPNQRVMPDTELYTLVDLSRIWVIADVFEYESPEVRLGQVATVTLAYDAGKKFPGKVSFILPQVDPMTRTLKVRIELDNPGVLLKPDMFADVEFRMASAMRLSVPVEAVLDSGKTKMVFVDRGEGYFEPRHVETGERMGERIEIRSGLRAGERVVTSGNFLIDSESQLKAAAAGMGHEHD